MEGVAYKEGLTALCSVANRPFSSVSSFNSWTVELVLQSLIHDVVNHILLQGALE